MRWNDYLASYLVDKGRLTRAELAAIKKADHYTTAKDQYGKGASERVVRMHLDAAVASV